MHISPSALRRSKGTPKENIPDFATWKVTELKNECKRLGLAPSRRLKQGLVDLLYDYYATHDMRHCQRKPDVIVISDSESDAPSTSVEIVESMSSQTPTQSAGTDLSKAFSTLRLEDNLGLPKSMSSACDEIYDVYNEKPNAMDKPMCNAIFANKKLHMRILLMEPISLDEFYGVAHSAGVLNSFRSTARKRAKLRAWLDSQGICFYESNASYMP